MQCCLYDLMLAVLVKHRFVTDTQTYRLDGGMCRASIASRDKRISKSS